MVRVQTEIPEEIHQIMKTHAAATSAKIDCILRDGLIEYFSHPKFNYCREAIEKGKIPFIVK